MCGYSSERFLFYFLCKNNFLGIKKCVSLNSCYHSCSPPLKLLTSLSSSEGTLKGKTKDYVHPNWVGNFCRFKKIAASQACLCCSPLCLCKSQGEELCQIQIAYPFPLAVFSGNQVPCPWIRGCSGGGRELGICAATVWMSRKGIWTDRGIYGPSCAANGLGCSKTLSVI